MSARYGPLGVAAQDSRRPRFSRSYKSTYDEFGMYLRANFWIGVLVMATAVVSGALVVNEYKDTHWTVNYWLEGDNSLNGDTLRHISMVIPAFVISVTILTANVLILGLRWHGDCEFKFMENWSNYSNNALIYGCIGVSEAFITLFFTQVVGNSNLWAMIYVTVLTLLGDLIGVAIRIYWVQRKNEPDQRGGSSWWAPLLYLCVKMTPLVFLAVSADRVGLPTNVKVAFWLFFGVTTFRVCLMFVAQMLAIMSCSSQWNLYRCLVMQPNVKASDDQRQQSQDQSVSRTRYRLAQALDNEKTKNKTRIYLGLVMFLNFACTLIFTFFTQLGCTGRSVCREVYERLTYTLTLSGGESVAVQFDRVWPVLQVAVPFQFGLLTLVAGFYLVAVRQFQLAWVNVADFMHDLCFAVADFFFVWVILNMTGTTELSELLLGATLILACNMLFAESRSKYPWYFALIPSLAALLPFAHASSNIAMLQNRSNQELAWTIVAFVCYAIRNSAFLAMRYVWKTHRNGGEYNKYFDEHPIVYVNVRYWVNWVLRWIVIGVWLSGSFHHGDDISNKK